MVFQPSTKTELETAITNWENNQTGGIQYFFNSGQSGTFTRGTITAFMGSGNQPSNWATARR